MRGNAGVIWMSIVALFLGVLAVTQIKAQDVYTRSLELETPSSLTTLIANLAERNNALRDEIFDLKLRTEAARDEHAVFAGHAAQADVGAKPDDAPGVAAAWVRLAQHDDVIEVERHRADRLLPCFHVAHETTESIREVGSPGSEDRARSPCSR